MADDNKCSHCNGTGTCQKCADEPYSRKQCDYCRDTKNCAFCYGSGRKR